ncbi:hypothetical protein AX774_g7303 [Zancudomyces culisetae]|uniref:Uncharacterized protein n=1 Tax=Zancudomyces culisetae TaxID=1213189 RepID=A0A1R1PED5_ZANCU|nr:hypothetical protein AX774_g7303 [Zancudomyces culisetae]|eukprot:OMH79289.1 hypothetical protein AX774_g7303 [Zancudomyces culisetae]
MPHWVYANSPYFKPIAIDIANDPAGAGNRVYNVFTSTVILAIATFNGIAYPHQLNCRFSSLRPPACARWLHIILTSSGWVMFYFFCLEK